MSFWNGKKVLVTGAGGFIGSHLAERLVQEGAEVTAFVRYSSSGARGWLETSPHGPAMRFHHGDVSDRESVAAAMSGQDAVFHLAALIAIPYSYQAPRDYVRVNVEGTLNVLQVAREMGGVPVVCTSTSEVYGTARRAPIDEEHPLQGQSPYSATKIGADKLAEAFALSFGQPVVVCRPFNTFGPRQSARAVIPTIISQLLAGPVVRLGSLDPRRDLNYVENTVEGFLACGANPDAKGQPFNFGSGREVTIGELVEIIARIMKVEPQVEVEDRRVRPADSEVMRLIASSERAKAAFGWTPRISLEEGLERTIAWMAANQDRFRPAEYAV